MIEQARLLNDTPPQKKRKVPHETLEGSDTPAITRAMKKTTSEMEGDSKSPTVTRAMNTSTTLPRYRPTDLVCHTDRLHVVTHIAGGYMEHLYDVKYIQHLNFHFLKYLSVWETQVLLAKARVRKSLRYWPQMSHTIIDDFFESDGPYKSIKANIKNYDGKVALQTLDELTFYHALGFQDTHLFGLFHAAAHSRQFKLVFCPNQKEKSFEILTEFSRKGSTQMWILSWSGVQILLVEIEWLTYLIYSNLIRSTMFLNIMFIN